MWEIFASILALIMALAVIVTIYLHADHPLPQWPYGITINGLLSIYSVILRGCLAYVLTSCIGQLQWTWFSHDARPLYDAVLFDNAGRGPWGSIKWLWKHHIRQPLTALGAILTVLSLGIDPIVQQLVTPVDCTWPVSDINATLPRTSYVGFSPSDPALIPEATVIQLEKAITLGMSSSGEDIMAQCPTGNCTFPETYGTLGVCSSCEDISERLSLSYQCCTDDFLYNCTTVSNPASCIGADDLGINFVTALYTDGLNSSEIFNITSPQLEWASDDISYPDWQSTGFSFSLGRMQTSSLQSYRLGFNIDLQVILGNTIFGGTGLNPISGEKRPGCDTTAGQHDWGCRGYGAANCSLTLCVRLYNATVVNTRLLETLVDTVEFDPTTKDAGTGTNEYFGVIDTQCATPDDLSRLAAQNLTILEPQPPGRWRRLRIPYAFGTNATERLLPASLLDRRCVYLMDTSTAAGIETDVLWKLYDGTDLSASLLGNDVPVANQTLASGPWLSLLGSHSTLRTVSIRSGGPELMQRIYNYGDYSFDVLDEIMANVSESLTRFMRSEASTPEYATPATGVAWRAGTCLSVRWGWLAFPAALTACVLAFLAAVAAAAARSRLPPWKESLLAWVLYGPPRLQQNQHQHQRRQQHPPPPTTDRMESASRGVYVTLANAGAADPHVVETRILAERRLGRWEWVKTLLHLSSPSPADTKRSERGTGREHHSSIAATGADDEKVSVSVSERYLLRDSCDLGHRAGEGPPSVSIVEGDESAEEFRRVTTAALGDVKG